MPIIDTNDKATVLKVLIESHPDVLTQRDLCRKADVHPNTLKRIYHSGNLNEIIKLEEATKQGKRSKYGLFDKSRAQETLSNYKNRTIDGEIHNIKIDFTKLVSMLFPVYIEKYKDDAVGLGALAEKSPIIDLNVVKAKNQVYPQVQTDGNFDPELFFSDAWKQFLKSILYLPLLQYSGDKQKIPDVSEAKKMNYKIILNINYSDIAEYKEIIMKEFFAELGNSFRDNREQSEKKKQYGEIMKTKGKLEVLDEQLEENKKKGEEAMKKYKEKESEYREFLDSET